MMRLLTLCILFALCGAGYTQDYPKIELKSKNLKMTVYPPDAEKGFYRSSRFCWGGVLGDVEVGGMKLFQKWKDKHNPLNNDDIIGPVLEFGQEMPLGYTEAKVGERFVKLGVGELLKPEEKKYSFFTNYKVTNPGIWKVKPGQNANKYTNSIEMRQTLVSATGYCYHLYLKIVLDDKDGDAVMHVDYEIINTGTKKISTDVYNHNFFNVDNIPIGPGYYLDFDDAVEQTKESQFEGKAKVIGKRLEFPEVLEKGQAYGQLIGLADKRPFNHVYSIGYQNNDKGIRVTVMDKWPENTQRKKFTIWSIKTCVCPEPFYAVDIEPGDCLKWETTYKFIVSNGKK